MNNLDGQVVIVTGGGAGIGRGISLAFARAGARVGVLDVSLGAAERVVSEIDTAGGKAVPVEADVTDRGAIDHAVASVTAELGSLRVFVNNAGVGHVRPLLEIGDEECRRVFDVNVLGVLHGTQAAARKMIESGGGGCIVNIASVAGMEGRPLLAVYAMSKAAVISLTRSAALALAPHRIRVNAVCPGVVETDLYRQVRIDLDLAAAAVQDERAGSVPPAPLGNIGSAEDVAAMVVYLAGANGSYITGQAINVDGGRVMHG